jgi:hypothetical protein
MPAELQQFPLVPHRAAGINCNGSILAEQDGDLVTLRCNACRTVVGKLDKETCKRLENIRDGKQRVIGTRDANRLYTWHFDGGKLAAVKIDTPDPSVPGQSVDVREEIDLLVQAYGKPSTVKTVPYHNAYGLCWRPRKL